MSTYASAATCRSSLKHTAIQQDGDNEGMIQQFGAKSAGTQLVA
jgi:hypothetical protein